MCPKTILSVYWLNCKVKPKNKFPYKGVKIFTGFVRVSSVTLQVSKTESAPWERVGYF